MHKLTLLLCAALLTACASNATVTKTWMAPDIGDKDLHGVLVLAISQDAVKRQRFEDAFTQALKQQGVNAVASYTINSAKKITKADVIKMAAEVKVDTVLVTSFAGRDQQEVLHRGRTYYGVQPIYTGNYGSGRGYYGRGGVYGAPFEIAHVPDFYAQHKSLHLEANLYEIATEENLWRTAAGMDESDDNKAMMNSFIKSFMTQLKADKLVQ